MSLVDHTEQHRVSQSRRILILAHTGRIDAIQAALQVAHGLVSAGLTPVMQPKDATAVADAIADGSARAVGVSVEVLYDDCVLEDIHLGVVLGGDGSVLRAAEFVREADIPLLAVNLGHVGFLAESERTNIESTVQAIADSRYGVEERMAIDVHVLVDGHLVAKTWALNEVSVEKSNRERLLEVVIGVDERPISTFGCDGVVMATPTGSTAYAFSAGGPVVWPEVQAMLMVPLSAHALFSRPLVVSPDSVMSVEVLQRTAETGVLWCDGRRRVDLPPGATIQATRSEKPVRLARLNRTPFSERLVRKFNLSTQGWRGPISKSDREEMEARRRAQQANATADADEASVEVVEPYHFGPRVEPGPPQTSALTVITKPDDPTVHPKHRREQSSKEDDA